MILVRRLARPMLASIFITGGLGHFKALDHHVEAGRPVLGPLRAQLKERTGIDVSDETLVKAQGAVMLGAGTLFALGRFPRLSSAVLAATMVPTTYAGHAFWKETDPQARQLQKIQFYKNVALAGGALLGAVDTAGKPGLTYRANALAKQSRREARALAKQAALEARLKTARLA